MAGGQLVFQPPEFDWHAEDQQLAFEEWKGQITLALCASSINRDIWFATIIGYLSKEGFKRWNTLPISTDEETQKNPEAVFKATVLKSGWQQSIFQNVPSQASIIAHNVQHASQ